MNRFTLIATFVLAACGGSSEPAPSAVAVAPITEPPPAADPIVVPEPEPEPQPEPQAEGTPCTSAADCAQGEMCTGPEGCDVAWTCQPSRACTRDLRPYCGCDGRTIHGSGSCPPAPYSRRGEC